MPNILTKDIFERMKLFHNHPATIKPRRDSYIPSPERSKSKRRSGKILKTNIDESYDEEKEKKKVIDKFQKDNFVNIYLGSKNDLRIYKDLEKVDIFKGKLCSTYYLKGLPEVNNRSISVEDRVDIIKLKQQRKSIVVTLDQEEEDRKKLVLGSRPVSRKISLFESNNHISSLLNLRKRMSGEDNKTPTSQFNYFRNYSKDSSKNSKDSRKDSSSKYSRDCMRLTTIDSLKGFGLRTASISPAKNRNVKNFLKRDDFYFEK
jgi:hypothetical protein